MDAAANILQPYKEIVGHVTTIMTMARFLSGSFICWDIYKQGSTRGIGIMPFLLGLALYVFLFKITFLLIFHKLLFPRCRCMWFLR